MSEATPVVIPQENANDDTVTLITWLVADGFTVTEGQVIAEVENSKAVFEITAPVDGLIQHCHREGDDIDVGDVMCYIRAADSPPSPEASSPVDEEPPEARTAVVSTAEPKPEGGASAQAPRSPRFSHAAQALLQQYGLRSDMFDGRALVRSHDVLEKVGANATPSPSLPPDATKPLEASQNASAPLTAAGVPVRSEQLPRSKRVEARYLASSLRHTLASVITIVVPTRGLRDAAAQYELDGRNVSAILLFETARLLRKHPYFNAFYKDEQIHYYEDINIGFAIDADQGLKVPIIRNADAKSVSQIASEMQARLVDYLNHRLAVHALEGGTFTITDLSGEGVFTFQPLINRGQAAILGIGSEFYPPGSQEGFFTLILSFDHQLSEGRQAAQFLQALGQRLQAYETALTPMHNANAVAEPHCTRCLTPMNQLKEWNHVLVQTLGPNGKTGHLCTICLQGW